MVIIGLALLFMIVLGAMVFITGYQLDSKITMILGFMIMFMAAMPLIFH